MTQKILIGIAMTAIMVTIGIGTQNSVWALTENTGKEGTDGISLPKAAGPEMILVASPIAHKGDKPIFTLVPKPQEGIDGVTQVQPADPHTLILVGISPTHKGDAPLYQLVPRPDPNPRDYVS